MTNTLNESFSLYFTDLRKGCSKRRHLDTSVNLKKFAGSAKDPMGKFLRFLSRLSTVLFFLTSSLIRTVMFSLASTGRS